MSFSTLKPASCWLPPVTGGCGSHSKVLIVEMVQNPAFPSLQTANKEEKPLLRETFKATSRREIMHLAAASLGFLSLLLPEYAEARTRNADTRRKILGKLEELREKAGLSKPKLEGLEKNPKDEAEEKNTKPIEESEGKKPTPQQSTAPSLDGGLHLPLPTLLNGKMVETKVL
ncbi:unnamed protein product [Fraxinus pennsylvanica]|uniref:Uncharacterized protein n=1 Tax=Fraxinus pennsylvanica TaxID=56036 RepID=A0AAD2DJ79_9LAMI|nr:unnamed protein product [Fraxinus pennsylvanica]